MKAAKELLQRSEKLKKELAKSHGGAQSAASGSQKNLITPKVKNGVSGHGVKPSAFKADHESSVQDSSNRNDFSEYRDILQSHTENYSDDDFASSVMESLNVSKTHVDIDR